MNLYVYEEIQKIISEGYELSGSNSISFSLNKGDASVSIVAYLGDTSFDVSWRISEKLSRSYLDGPARYSVRDGIIMWEVYAEDGWTHRPISDGPAFTERNSAGKVVRQEFWVKGKVIKEKTVGHQYTK